MSKGQQRSSWPHTLTATVVIIVSGKLELICWPTSLKVLIFCVHKQTKKHLDRRAITLPPVRACARGNYL